MLDLYTRRNSIISCPYYFFLLWDTYMIGNLRHLRDLPVKTKRHAWLRQIYHRWKRIPAKWISICESVLKYDKGCNECTLKKKKKKKVTRDLNQMVRGKGSNFPLVADKFVLQVSIVYLYMMFVSGDTGDKIPPSSTLLLTLSHPLPPKCHPAQSWHILQSNSFLKGTLFFGSCFLKTYFTQAYTVLKKKSQRRKKKSTFNLTWHDEILKMNMIYPEQQQKLVCSIFFLFFFCEDIAVLGVKLDSYLTMCYIIVLPELNFLRFDVLLFHTFVVKIGFYCLF